MIPPFKSLTVATGAGEISTSPELDDPFEEPTTTAKVAAWSKDYSDSMFDGEFEMDGCSLEMEGE